MRYDFLSILEKIGVSIRDRKDVIDIIKKEFNTNLEYLVSSFNFKKKIIAFNNNAVLKPILRGNSIMGLTFSLEEKVGSEIFRLTKNLVFYGMEEKGVIVSTLEEVKNPSYNIYFANTKVVTTNNNGKHFLEKENLGLWIYDKRIIDNPNYQRLFGPKNALEVYDFFERFRTTEDKLKEEYILPDYFKTRHFIINEKEIYDIIKNYDVTTIEEETKNAIANSTHLGRVEKYNVFSDSIYKEFSDEDYKEIIPIKTSFKPTKKDIFSYRDELKKNKTKMKVGN